MGKDREWLESLKPGDLVIVSSGGGGLGSDVLRKVDKVNKVTVVVSGNKYSRADGSRRLSTWHTEWLLEPTAERAQAIRRGVLVRKLRVVDWDKFSYAQLSEIREVVSRCMRANEAEASKEPLTAGG